MSANKDRADERGVVRLEGELTLPRAEELKNLLARALADADAVTIRFGAVQEIDLSCLQLLCSVHRSALRLKKPVHIDGPIPSQLADAASVGGFLGLKGCKLDEEKSCLWMNAAGAHHG